MDILLSNVSVGVIYDLEGDRSGDIVYLSWVEGSRVVRGELLGVKNTSGACHGFEDSLELLVFNVYKVDKLLKLIDGN